MGIKVNQKRSEKLILKTLSIFIFFVAVSTSISFITFCKKADSEESGPSLYRNTDFKFRIKFPEGWKVSDGDGKNVVKKAELQGVGSINVLVKQGPNKLNGNDMSDADLISFGKQSIQPSLEWGNGKLMATDVVYINNQKAIFTRSNIAFKKLSGTFITINDQYSIFKNGYMYVITANCLESKFDEVKSDIRLAVDSFVLEEWN